MAITKSRDRFGIMVLEERFGHINELHSRLEIKFSVTNNRVKHGKNDCYNLAPQSGTNKL